MILFGDDLGMEEDGSSRIELEAEKVYFKFGNLTPSSFPEFRKEINLLIENFENYENKYKNKLILHLYGLLAYNEYTISKNYEEGMKAIEKYLENVDKPYDHMERTISIYRMKTEIFK